MSAGLGWWIAHVTFWILLGYGWACDELKPVGIGTFLLFWLLGFFGLPNLPYGADLFFSYVAVLDVILVFIVFKGDVRLN